VRAPEDLTRAVFAVSVGLAVLAVAAALAAGGERGWGPWPGGRLQRLAVPSWHRRRAERSGRGAGARERLSLGAVWAGLAGALVVSALGFGPAAAAGAGALSGWAWTMRVRSGRKAAGRQLGEQLEETLEVIVASLRAGRTLTEALEDGAGRAKGALAGILAAVVSAHRAGRPLDEALKEIEGAGGPGGPNGPGRPAELAYLGACLRTHARTGGDVTALLSNLGGVLRERRAAGRELEAKTGEARATAVLLGLLPPGLAVYVLWASPRQLEPLLGSTLGLAALTYAGLSWVVGAAVIRRMLAAVTRQVEGEG